MHIGNIDTQDKVLIVAEIGNNHEGNIELAKRMIESAAKAGADAVKFQILRAEKLIQPQDENRFQVLKKFELSFSQFRDLSSVARDEGLLFLSTPFDLEAAEFLNDLVPAFKIASGDNNFIPLLERLALFCKPIIMSTGLAEFHDILYAKALIQNIWGKNNTDVELALLHCVTSYPTPKEEANLSAIRFLREKIGGCVGYSDHCLGIEAAVASVSVGARIVEKHFTLDKNYSNYHDHQLSADPDELAVLVRRIRETEILIGSKEKSISSSEVNNLIPVRRSIAAVKDLSAGHYLTWNDLCWLRPGKGIPPGNEKLILGRVLKQGISRGTLLNEDMLD